MKQKCPVCQNSEDYLVFTFSHQFFKGKELKDNPSDFYELFMCPNLHIFDNNNELIKPHEPPSPRKALNQN